MTSKHSWHDILFGAGVSWGEMEALEEGAGRPDILGINHYLTSDRFLDHRCERYPPERCGHNEFMAYADALLWLDQADSSRSPAQKGAVRGERERKRKAGRGNAG